VKTRVTDPTKWGFPLSQNHRYYHFLAQEPHQITKFIRVIFPISTFRCLLPFNFTNLYAELELVLVSSRTEPVVKSYKIRTRDRSFGSYHALLEKKVSDLAF